MSYITLMLPVIWAVVATGIGLLLYKSSRAVFEDSAQRQGLRNRRIRLTGSIVIAAIAFLGMERSTPRERLYELPVGSLIVQRSAIQEMYENAVEIDRLSLELAGTLARESGIQGRPKLEALRVQTASLPDNQRQY